MGAPNWKHTLQMLPSIVLHVYKPVIANMIVDAQSQVRALPRTEIADRNGLKGELERFGLALFMVDRELKSRESDRIL